MRHRWIVLIPAALFAGAAAGDTEMSPAAGQNKLLPAVQKAGMAGMGSMAGMGGNQPPPEPDKPGPQQIGGGNVPPVDPDKSKLLPAVQKAGMGGMDGMVGMGGSTLPAIQAPNIGGDANQLPAVQLPALSPAGGMPGGMGPAGFKH